MNINDLMQQALQKAMEERSAKIDNVLEEFKKEVLNKLRIEINEYTKTKILSKYPHDKITTLKDELQSLDTIDKIKTDESYTKLLEYIEKTRSSIAQERKNFLDSFFKEDWWVKNASGILQKKIQEKIQTLNSAEILQELESKVIEFIAGELDKALERKLLPLEKLFALLTGDAITNPTRFKNAFIKQVKKIVKLKIKLKITRKLEPLVAAAGNYLDYLNELAKKDETNEKLKRRINAMETLQSQLSNISTIDEAVTTHVKEALKVCLENQPTWFEKPFREKLIDILTLGFAVLVRYIRGTKESRTIDLISSWVKMTEESKPCPTIPNPSSSSNEPYNSI
jgi:hypothetical protein